MKSIRRKEVRRHIARSGQVRPLSTNKIHPTTLIKRRPDPRSIIDLDAATWLQICPLLTAIPVSVCSLPPQGSLLSFVHARFLCAANRTRNTDFAAQRWRTALRCSARQDHPTVRVMHKSAEFLNFNARLAVLLSGLCCGWLAG
jgi:hypothetical protein